MPADLIVYILVAAGLVFWLRSILGTRHGDEPQRPNPYIQVESAKESLRQPYAAGEQVSGPEEHIRELAEKPRRNLSVENKAAENGLLDISRADRGFDIGPFLEKAQDAYVMIVEAFAEGDKEMLRDLLAEPVYKIFEQAVDERERRGEKALTEIQSISKAEVIDAKVQNKMAFVTLRFTAEEVNVVRDGQGNIISGHPERINVMRDVWTFGRKVNSKDPRWFLYETSDEPGDESGPVPNTG